jgi:hypothetical protein
MTLKLLPLTALILGLTGGVALADRDNGRGGDHGRSGDHRGRDHRGGDYRGGDHRGGGDRRVVVRDHGRDHRDHRVYDRRGDGRHYGNRSYYRNDHRRPIYVSRPVIRERYYHYNRRPALIIESHNPMEGYFWVAGQWTWSGAEWIWQPGHYQPDPNYVSASLSYGYGY